VLSLVLKTRKGARARQIFWNPTVRVRSDSDSARLSPSTVRSDSTRGLGDEDRTGRSGSGRRARDTAAGYSLSLAADCGSQQGPTYVRTVLAGQVTGSFGRASNLDYMTNSCIHLDFFASTREAACCISGPDLLGQVTAASQRHQQQINFVRSSASQAMRPALHAIVSIKLQQRSKSRPAFSLLSESLAAHAPNIHIIALR
jgi:hypothetical protein